MGACGVHRTEGNVLANCTSRGLTSIPIDLPRDTNILLAENNDISTIPNNVVSRLGNLTQLHLSYNKIVNISSHAFMGLKQLLVVKLDSNRIKTSQLDGSLFRDLVNLQALKMDHNDFKSEDDYNEPLFLTLVNLQTLEMDALTNAEFGAGFSHLTSLVNLTLYGQINHIHNNTFNAFGKTSLKNLGITAGVNQVDSMSFSCLKSLLSLNLAFNENLGMQVANSWKGLTLTKINALLLERINYGHWLVLRHDFFRDLDKTQLHILVLDNNQIIFIERGFHTFIPHLEELYLRKNYLSSVFDVMCDACYLDNLFLIDITIQYRASIDMLDLDYFRHDSAVDIDSNNSHDNDKCELTCKNDTRINGSIHIVLPLKMRYILMSTALSISVTGNGIPDIYVHGQNDLQLVDLSYNIFRDLRGRMYFPGHTATHIKFDFSYNQCFKINPDFWEISGDNIDSLLLQSNRLGDLLTEQGNQSFLKWLNQLTELNLANNNIRTLPRNIFSTQINLQTLNLADNALMDITFELLHLKYLTNLDLSDNFLTQLTDTVYDVFSHNMHLSLLGNPLSCTCDSIGFLEWMDKLQAILVSWNKYTCTYKGKWTSFDVLANTIIPDLTIACSSKTLLVISAVTLSAVCLILCTSVCLYRHRFEVKYACIRLIWQRKKYDHLIRNDQLMYKYDAFVAYHKDDIWFVRHHMIKQLEETDSHLKLCIHQRDFMPGSAIEENIIDAIESSRKTILVLTKNFLLSYWCDFEYHMARMRCLERGDDAIVIIILEELPVRYISKPLLAWLKRRTYLEWPEHSLEEPHFWEKLKEAIEC